MQETDPFGRIVSWARDVTVLSAAHPQSLNIYNSAGELVRSLDMSVIASRDIVVLKNPDSQSAVDVKVVPNPVGPKDRQVSFLFSPLPFGRHAQLMLYNLSGDLVAQGVSNAGADRLILNIGPWSSGIYLGVFEVREGGGLVSRRQLRVALRR